MAEAPVASEFMSQTVGTRSENGISLPVRSEIAFLCSEPALVTVATAIINSVVRRCLFMAIGYAKLNNKV